MKKAKNTVALFAHEDECKGEYKSIGGHRMSGLVYVNHGHFCSGCKRLMIDGKMFKYLFECPREKVFTNIGK